MRNGYVWLLAAIVAVSVLVCGICRADETSIIDELKKLPSVNSAVVYSIPDAQFDYAISLPVATISIKKVTINLNIGAIPQEEELIGLIGVDLLKVENYLDWPILKYVEVSPFVYYGFKRIGGINADQDGNSESDFGVGVNILKVKF